MDPTGFNLEISPLPLSTSSTHLSLLPLSPLTKDRSSDHFYPPSASRLYSDASLVASHNKVFLVGEFDWTDTYYQPLVYLAVLVPVIIAALLFVLPGRWWPWTMRIPIWRRRNRGRYEGVQHPSTSTKDLQLLDMPRHMHTEPTSSYSPQRTHLEISIRRWHFSLLIILIFSPILAIIIHSLMPSPSSAFLASMESLVASSTLAGSFYWSLFGRDNNCCAYVQHSDGFTLHYPVAAGGGVGGSTTGDGGKVGELARHAWGMRGKAGTWDEFVAGGGWPDVQCPQAALAVPVGSNWTGGIGG